MKKILFALTLVSFSALAANGPITQQCQGNAAGCKKYCEESMHGVYTASNYGSGSCTWDGSIAWNFNGSKPKKLSPDNKNAL